MRTITIPAAVVSATALMCGGCTLLMNLAAPPVTSVRLQNNSDFEVRVVLYIDDEQDLPRDALTEVGTRLEFTLAPGGSTVFSRDCEDLQAVVIDGAELRVLGQVGPEADSGVLRDGSDFDCRDTVVFTFDHSALIVDFAVTSAVQKG
jgi:hypothetical protein